MPTTDHGRGAAAGPAGIGGPLQLLRDRIAVQPSGGR